MSCRSALHVCVNNVLFFFSRSHVCTGLIWLFAVWDTVACDPLYVMSTPFYSMVLAIGVLAAYILPFFLLLIWYKS